MKKLICMLLIAATMILLVSCGSTKVDKPETTAEENKNTGEGGLSKGEAEQCKEELQGYLDCIYHGKTDGIEDGEALYESNVETICDLLKSHTNALEEYLTDEQNAKYLEITKAYMDMASYEITVEEGEGGIYFCTVNTDAIHILADTKDEITAYRAEWHKRYESMTDEELDARTDDQWRADYVESTDAILAILNDHLASVKDNATQLPLDGIVYDAETESGFSMETYEFNNYIIGITQ